MFCTYIRIIVLKKTKNGGGVIVKIQNIFAEYAKLSLSLHTKIRGIFSKKRRMSARLGKGEHNLLFEKKLG